jgi:hypothetical protein
MNYATLLLPICIVMACRSKGDETMSVTAAASTGSAPPPVFSPPPPVRGVGKQHDVQGDHCCKCNNGCQKSSTGGGEAEAACLAWCTSKGDPGHSLGDGQCKGERC